MDSPLVNGLSGLFLGVINLGPGHVIMIAVACALLYLGIEKGYEPFFSCRSVSAPLWSIFHWPT